MSAINRQPKKTSNSSSKKSIITVGGIITIGAVLLFAYLMWYVAPEEVVESVKVIATTEEGCIAVTKEKLCIQL